MARETHVGRVLVVGDGRRVVFDASAVPLGRAFAATPLILGLNAFIIRLLQYLQLIFVFSILLCRYITSIRSVVSHL